MHILIIKRSNYLEKYDFLILREAHMYIFGTILEVTAFLLIIFNAWKWPTQKGLT